MIMIIISDIIKNNDKLYKSYLHSQGMYAIKSVIL